VTAQALDLAVAGRIAACAVAVETLEERAQQLEYPKP
jgi:hypothetical protein